MVKHHKKLSPAADTYLQMASRLKRQMMATRAAIDRASEQRIQLELLRLDKRIGSEVSQLLEQAKKVHDDAYEAHLIALRRYHDFVTQGIVYGEGHGRPS